MIALIPARAGSKRIPMKNIKRLNNIPLIAYTITTAKALFNPVIVSSDSNEILIIASNYGAIPLKRPLEYCQDDSTDFDVVQHFLNHYPTDYIAYLRPTTPLRDEIIVHNAEHLFSRMNADRVNVTQTINWTGLRSVELMAESAWKCFMLENGHLIPFCEGYNLPNQLVNPTYKANGYIDIIDTNWIGYKDLFGPRVYGYVTPPVIEVDTQEEFEYLEWSMTKNVNR